MRADNKMISLRRNLKFGSILFVNFINLNDEEKEFVRNLRNSESIRKAMYSEKIITKIKHSDFISKLRFDNQNFYWLAKLKKNDYIGVVYLNMVNKEHRNAYLGIYTNPYSMLSNKGAILIECLKKAAFSKAGLHTLKLEVLKDNTRAVNFYKKNGFIVERKLKEFVKKDGQWKGVLVMGINNTAKNS